MGSEPGGNSEDCGPMRRLRVHTDLGPIEVYANSCTYPPGDDSALCIRAMKVLRERGRRYGSVLDLGSGSGILALAAMRLLGASRVAAVEAYLCPAIASRETLGDGALVAVCPYASCLRGGWDLAVVNPPYLPEDPGGARGPCAPPSSWWAGSAGVMEGMLRAAASLSGEVLAVYSTLSPVDAERLLASMGFRVEVLAEEAFFMERLRVAWAWRG